MRREELLTLAPPDDRDWYNDQIRSLDDVVLLEEVPQAIIADMARLRSLEPNQAVAWGRYLPDRDVTEYAVGLYDDLTPGIFHRITGVLTSHGLQILSASIHTLAGHLVLDRFYVRDPDYEGPPPDDRLHAVGNALVEVIENPNDANPVFRRIWRPSTEKASEQLELLPTRVIVDNSTLPDFTIVDVFANDRVGLLYTITRTLYELNLSVHYAKIGTYLDQVVDVFYLTDLEGLKITDESRWEHIRSELLKSISQSGQPAS